MAIGGEEANWSVYELEQTRDPVQAVSIGSISVTYKAGSNRPGWICDSLLVTLHRISARRDGVGVSLCIGAFVDFGCCRVDAQLCEDYAVAFVDWTREKEAVHSQHVHNRSSLLC